METGLVPQQEMSSLFLFSSLQACSLLLLKQRKPRVQELPEEEANFPISRIISVLVGEWAILLVSGRV